MSKILLDYQSNLEDKILDFWRFWSRKNRYKYSNLSIYAHSIFKSKNLNINKEGFRSKINFSEKFNNNQPNIFFIGPSSLFGMPNLSDEETLTSIIERKLIEQKKNFNIFNFGLIGSIIGTQSNLLLRLLIDQKPDIVVIYNGYNDLMSGYYNWDCVINCELDLILKKAFEAEGNKNNPIFHLENTVEATINLINEKIFNKISFSKNNLDSHPLKERRKKVLKEKKQPNNNYNYWQRYYLNYLNYCFYFLNKEKIKTIYVPEASILSTNKPLTKYENEYKKVGRDLGLFKDSDYSRDVKQFKAYHMDTINKAIKCAEDMKIKNFNFEEHISKKCDKEHIFFDYVHLTDHGTKILADQILNKL